MAVAVLPRLSSKKNVTPVSLTAVALTPVAVPAAVLKKALVVDDSTTILHVVCSLLEHHKIVNVVGRLESGLEAVDGVGLLKPDLLLMDADMPEMSALRSSLVISQLYPEVRIVLMSMETGHRFVQACHDCGAHAVIYKPRFLTELTEVLQADAPQMIKPISELEGTASGAK